MHEKIAENQVRTILKLPPLPLWKWLFAIVLLLSVPVAILIKQTVGAFEASARAARDEKGREAEKLSSRIAFEMKTPLQIKETMQEFFVCYKVPLKQQYHMRMFLKNIHIPLPLEFLLGLRLAENNLEMQKQRLARSLKKFIPGAKLLKWGSDLKLSGDSDPVFPKWAYQKLYESILARRTRDRAGSIVDTAYLANIPMLGRYFGESAPLGSFVKFPGDIIECNDPTGAVLYLFWEGLSEDAFDGSRHPAGGFIGVVNGESLTSSFGLQMLMKRKGHEWSDSGIAAGWVVENERGECFLPYPFLTTDRSEWISWAAGRPDGLYERKGLVVSLRRSYDNVILLAAASIQDINDEYVRNIFRLVIVLLAAVMMPVFLLITHRRNDGISMSIRMQIASLFLFAMVLPCAAVFQLGNELLKDRQKAYEEEAYKTIDRVKKDLDENMNYAFRHLEKISDVMGREIMQLDFDNRGKIAEPSVAKAILRAYVENVNYLHFYMFNSAAELVMTDSNREEDKEGMGLLPLVQSLAKIKLRSSGMLKASGRVGEISMMDLLVEATGGAKLSDIQAILRNRENRAFELKFSGRRSCFFIGQYFPRSRPKEAHIIVLLIRDSQFEKMYMRMMIERLSEQPHLKNRIQLFFGKNGVGDNDYFYPAPLQNPWFEFYAPVQDSLRLGRLSEPTRFVGATVKEKVVLEKGQRKCLFYSFKPASLELNSVVALFDYAEITRELLQLRNFILISLLVSFIVILVLARVMARSLLEPVAILKQGVEEIRAGNYNTELVLPGQDEMVDLARAFNIMSQGLDERDRMTRYLSKSAVDAVVSGEDRVMGGKRVPATILFSDIRSFTTISESNDPEVVVALLNEYFAVMNGV
ncbi:MAG: HAMP domain-containing protein, partial [Candidatus Riflebacteria bacterium]|nr:HAMP domain-containing protein [Candidatus Riflebacteria bacterium]